VFSPVVGWLSAKAHKRLSHKHRAEYGGEHYKGGAYHYAAFQVQNISPFQHMPSGFIETGYSLNLARKATAAAWCEPVSPSS
jgi:hypothetical protein